MAVKVNSPPDILPPVASRLAHVKKAKNFVMSVPT
jgi:hypothetical protein